MATRIFIVDSTPTDFYYWLRDYTRRVGIARFPTEHGAWIALAPARSMANDETPWRIVMTAQHLHGDPHYPTYLGEEPGVWFSVTPLEDGRLKVEAWSLPAVASYLHQLLAYVGMRWPGLESLSPEHRNENALSRAGSRIASETPTKPYGPTERTYELAEAAKRLKDANPTLSQMDVAMELNTTPESIRYAYRSMGWKWERADRVRANR